MSKVGDLYIELQGYVYDALEFGAQTEYDVMEYLKQFHSDFPLDYDKDVIARMVEDYHFA